MKLSLNTISKNVTVAGTPEALSASVLHTPVAQIQAKLTNTDTIYVGISGLNKATLANCAITLEPGDVWNLNAVLGNQHGGDILDLSTIYIDADVSGNGVLVAYYKRVNL